MSIIVKMSSGQLASFAHCSHSSSTLLVLQSEIISSTSSEFIVSPFFKYMIPRKPRTESNTTYPSCSTYSGRRRKTLRSKSFGVFKASPPNAVKDIINFNILYSKNQVFTPAGSLYVILKYINTVGVCLRNNTLLEYIKYVLRNNTYILTANYLTRRRLYLFQSPTNPNRV